MMLTTQQLAILTHTSYRTAFRLSKTLQLSKTMIKRKFQYFLSPTHPLFLSIQLAKNTQAKPIYSIRELANLWQWRKGSYSCERVRQLLSKYDIPVINKDRKGYVYLSDIKQLLVS